MVRGGGIDLWIGKQGAQRGPHQGSRMDKYTQFQLRKIFLRKQLLHKIIRQRGEIKPPKS
jgi:hypothetical protein